MIVDGKRYRYSGTIPLSLSPWTAAASARRSLALGQMCKAVPLDAPWNAKKAAKWDQITVAQWLGRNVRSRAAHDLLETAIAGTYTSAASEVSLLFALHQMASGGGPGFVFGIKDASQDSRPVGGMGAIYHKVATELGGAVHLNQPVRRIDRRRRRRHRALRRNDDPGATGDRRSAAGHREPNRLRANASRRTGISASTDANRLDHQDLDRLRRTVLAGGRVVGAVGRAGFARHGHHRRLHRHGQPRGAVRDRRGADRAASR